MEIIFCISTYFKPSLQTAFAKSVTQAQLLKWVLVDTGFDHGAAG